MRHINLAHERLKEIASRPMHIIVGREPDAVPVEPLAFMPEKKTHPTSPKQRGGR